MKFLRSSLSLVLFLFVSQSFAQVLTTDEPVEYSDYIIQMHNSFSENSIRYTQETVHSDDLEYNEKLRVSLLKQIDQSLSELKQLKDFRGDTKLRDEAVEVFDMYKVSFSTDFPKVDLLKKDSKESYEAMEEYFAAQDKAEDKLRKTGIRFKKAHEVFAKKYDIKIMESEEDDRLDIISNSHAYSRAIFLQFFKVSKANAAFMEVMQAQKTNAMDAKRKSLETSCTEALAGIKLIEAYNSDFEYRNASNEYIKYLQNLCKNEFVEMISIIKSDERTQKDVDRYNSIIQEYNTHSQKLVQQFNQANRNFLRKNIPKTSK